MKKIFFCVCVLLFTPLFSLDFSSAHAAVRAFSYDSDAACLEIMNAQSGEAVYLFKRHIVYLAVNYGDVEIFVAGDEEPLKIDLQTIKDINYVYGVLCIICDL